MKTLWQQKISEAHSGKFNIEIISPNVILQTYSEKYQVYYSRHYCLVCETRPFETEPDYRILLNSGGIIAYPDSLRQGRAILQALENAKRMELKNE